jgi:phosphatidyl-myo-inositol alpha-mannosyltransferase
VGGVTEHVHATARLLRRRGHRVTIITSGPPGRLGVEPDVLRVGLDLSVRYNGAENKMTVGLDLPEQLGRVLDRGAFDVLHVHCPLAPVLPLLALRLARCPVVGTFHSVSSDLPYRVFSRILDPLFRNVDRAIAVSEAARTYISKHFPGEVEVVPNGVDLSRFRPGLPRLERYGREIPTILFVGRFDPRKGLPELIDACTLLAGESIPFRLILVGDGALRASIERRARRGPLRGRVHFEGRVDHARLPAYYASSDLFCSPARGGESFGLVLLEAMASGIPVVATDLPGYRTVLTPGREGLLVPARDPLALAAALKRLLQDPDQRMKMGARGAEAARPYGWELVVDRLETIYAELAPVAFSVGHGEAGSLRSTGVLEAAVR